MTTDRKLMPLMRTGLFIDFDLLDERQAMKNHGQTLTRLAERGGLSVCEALAIAQRRKWERWDFKQAVEALAALEGVPAPAASQATAGDALSQAARDVLAERRRQIDAEGWTPEHDDEHSRGEMALAAACYAVADNDPRAEPPPLWPWDTEWWKPTSERRMLVKAGALILAEIERLDRASAQVADAEGQR